MDPRVDDYIHRSTKWQKELNTLRTIIQDCGLTEQIKWGVPCYTYRGSNVVLMHTFKNYCALLFHKGALLKDQENILIQQTKNVQAARQVRFTNVDEVLNVASTLKTYIHEAIEVEKAGLKVEFKETSEFEMPEEFQVRLDEDPELRSAFYALTPGRQRGYLLFFSAPKGSKTRISRIEKNIPRIHKGLGLHDR